MANQYTGSFEHKVREKFDCSAEELLSECEEKNMTYHEVEQKLGVSASTVRKWARKFGLNLQPSKQDDVAQEHAQHFIDPNMNAYNFLSRTWKQH